MEGDAYARLIFGQYARHVPGWLYVQEGPDERTVSFVGSSRVSDGPHPLRYGSRRTHQLAIGEVIVRPHLVVASDIARGAGLAGLVTGEFHDPMIRSGEVLVDIDGTRAERYRRTS
jgi:hypothetical protein